MGPLLGKTSRPLEPPPAKRQRQTGLRARRGPSTVGPPWGKNVSAPRASACQTPIRGRARRTPRPPPRGPPWGKTSPPLEPPPAKRQSVGGLGERHGPPPWVPRGKNVSAPRTSACQTPIRGRARRTPRSFHRGSPLGKNVSAPRASARQTPIRGGSYSAHEFRR